MHSASSIRKISEICLGNRVALPELAGVYAFWWIADRDELLAANCHIVLKGPSGRLVDVEFKDWWPPELEFPCLYVGKSTNIKKRLSLHIMRGFPARQHQIPGDNQKQRTVTTSCQVRYGTVACIQQPQRTDQYNQQQDGAFIYNSFFR
ncbi:hypothetical protein ACUN9Y_03255 [Halomonas sp. V046]|uniref:hypothetical protein n=1 Tax=Halomonas sp. V046 TaxID=3459611 RepID=UPI004043E930